MVTQSIQSAQADLPYHIAKSNITDVYFVMEQEYYALTGAPTAADGAISVAVGDVDADADIDVLSGSWNDNTVAWYENNGTGGFGSRQIITSDANDTWSAYPADLDGDGDLDVLSAWRGSDTVVWQENNGTGGFGPPQVISDQATGAIAIHAVDLAGDGDLDE